MAENIPPPPGGPKPKESGTNLGTLTAPPVAATAGVNIEASAPVQEKVWTPEKEAKLEDVKKQIEDLEDILDFIDAKLNTTRESLEAHDAEKGASRDEELIEIEKREIGLLIADPKAYFIIKRDESQTQIDLINATTYTDPQEKLRRQKINSDLREKWQKRINILETLNPGEK